MTNTMNTKDFAAAIGTDAKTLRKYLRSVTPRDEQPGQGSRWELAGTKTAIAKHTKGFAKWSEDELKRRADRAAKVAAELAGKVEGLDKDDDALADAPEVDAEPTDEDLAAIDEDADQD